LKILGGKREGETLDLEAGTYQVGTGRAADIQLRDKGVGFKHAEITVRNGQLFVKDFKSRGGTFVDGARVEANVEIELIPGVALRIGTTELQITAEVEAEVDAPAKEAVAEPEPQAEVAPEPEAVAEAEAVAEPEPEPQPEVEREAPVVAEPEPQPEVEREAPVVAEPEPEPEPQPEVEREAPVVAEPEEPEPEVVAELEPEPLSNDVNLLQQQIQDLRRSVASKSQEIDALTTALDGQPSGDDAMDPMLGGALGGYGAAIDDGYRDKILDLQAQLQIEAAKVFEREETIRAIESRLKDAELGRDQELESLKANAASTNQSLARAYTEIATLKNDLAKSQDLEELEEANALLLDENETLKEELEGVRFKVEEEQSARGSLVRGRVTDLRAETQRMEESNTQMRTLVEAYEEKIDELDEHLEELEGENEALQTLVADLRADLAKAKKERETMVKTLRKKLKATEKRLDEARAKRARSQAEPEHRQAV
jgi:pSer/pThr/pTyr-binding forkhead associated (FHA) protein/predicted RNase H-like nuclease (RuvC/YqgF family)